MERKVFADRDAAAIWSIATRFMPDEPDTKDIRMALAKAVGLYIDVQVLLDADPVTVHNQDGDLVFTLVGDEVGGFAVEY